jgi:small conductance mechanosensitive channel
LALLLLLIPPLAIDIDTDALISDVLQSGGRILLILLLAFVAVRLIQRILTPAIRVAIRQGMTGEPESETARRIETLSDVIYRTTAAVIAVVAVVTILPEFGINAGPLIAGLGLVGIAVGFGAQHIVRDVINGVEILLENQYGRGDLVRMRSTTAGVYSGRVEDLNLRRTVLRDADGALHFIPHGHVEAATNLSRGPAGMAFSLTVAYGEDLTRVFEIVDAAGRELAADATFGPLVRQAPRAAGLDRLGEASVEVRVEGSSVPGEQARVGGELRRRLKQAFDAAGIKARDTTPPAAGQT